jgi:menaquinone-9 beta-reductase
MLEPDYDVAIVGASIAGCTAAIVYGRAGLRVALLEKHRNVATHKVLCGHFLLGGAHGTLLELGLWQELVERHGAGTGGLSMWSQAGWMPPPATGVAPFLNVRRSTLDPLLRSRAAASPGVELLLDRSVDALEYAGARVVGVRARRHDGSAERFRARLVVGADGYRSKVAQLSQTPERRYDNGRFFLYAYYRGVGLRQPGDASLWWHGRDLAVVSPTDGGLVEVALMPTKDQLPRFQKDRAGELARYVARLPDAPDMSGAELVSKIVTAVDYPLIRRPAVPAPGLALIGDAAMTSDPTPAPGCTYALLTGRWLAASTTDALANRRSLETGLRRYRRQRRFVERHDRLIRIEAAAPPPNPVQRMLREAATHDEATAIRLSNFGMQAAPISSLLNPATLARAGRVAYRARHKDHRSRKPVEIH